MSTSADKKFQQNIVDELKKVAHKNAVDFKSHDKGFDVIITGNEIKENTNRSRISTPVLDEYAKVFEGNGFAANVNSDINALEIHVPAILSNNDTLSLTALKDKSRVIDEINIREARKLQDE